MVTVAVALWLAGGLCLSRPCAAVEEGPRATPVIEVYASESQSWLGDDSVSPVVGQHSVSAVAGHTTYRLRLQLAPEQRSVYALYGDRRETPHVPPAYFDAYAAGDKIHPPATNLYLMMPGMMNDLLLTSFLSLGPDNQDTPSNFGSVGSAIDNWSETQPLTLGVNPGPTDDFSLFWMDPTQANNYYANNNYFANSNCLDAELLCHQQHLCYACGPLLAQLTIPSGEGFFVRIGVQGKPTDAADADWYGDETWVHKNPDGSCPTGQVSAPGEDTCMYDADECASNPCGSTINAGGCWHGVDEWACICSDGTTTVDPMGCQEAPSVRGCMDSDAENYNPFATVSTDTCIAPNPVDACQSIPCANGATCVDAIDSYICACASGYDGTNCGSNVDECQSIPCANGAACIDSIDRYFCACASGYDGTNCGSNFDECQRHPCANGATCVDAIDSYFCACASGYDGINCGNNVNECESIPCANGANYCMDAIDSYICDCASGYDGTNCGNNVDECQSIPCANGATCVDAIDSYICACASGYDGTNCGSNVDECQSIPCANGATCVDAIDSYICACASGYDGTN
eukprot:COSAG05_NODE_3297_length_2169_cov_15.159420_2_plen_576_part_01